MYADVNASQADDKLTVEFYVDLWQNHGKSLEEGRPIFEEREFIKIAVPGNQTLLIDTLCEDHHKQRFAGRYQQFQQARNMEDVVQGTPLSQWPLITRVAAEKLRYMKFNTVEQIAGADDYQLNAIGMAVGMSPWEFKKQAQAYLEASKKTAEISKRTAELDLMRADNDDLRSQNIEQGSRIAELERQIAILASAQVEKTVRKKKVQEE